MTYVTGYEMICVYCTARMTYVTGYEMIWVYCTARVTYVTGYEMICVSLLYSPHDVRHWL